MDADNLIRIIHSLGKIQEDLISLEIIPNNFKALDFDDDTQYGIEVERGFELIFFTELERFESFYIDAAYLKEHNKKQIKLLPFPFSEAEERASMIRAIGEPIYSKSSEELKEFGVDIWDTYQLPISMHPEALLDIQYNAEGFSVSLTASLMDKNI